MKDQLLSRIHGRTAAVAIIGLGYVGLPLAVAFAEAGFPVVGKALITGISGQDGSYLAEFLLSKGYAVHGIMRRASTFNTHRLDHIYRDPHNGDAVQLYLHYGDIGSSGNLSDIMRQVQPDEIYHLAAQSHVRVSFDLPDYTGDPSTGSGQV